MAAPPRWPASPASAPAVPASTNLHPRHSPRVPRAVLADPALRSTRAWRWRPKAGVQSDHPAGVLKNWGNGGQGGVGESSPDEGDAEWRVAIRGTRRNCDRAEIEQIDEIRIGSELYIAADRIGGNLYDRHGSRRDRHHKHVDALEDILRLATQRGQAVGERKKVRSAPVRGAIKDGLDHRQEALLVLLDGVAHPGNAFGDPRSRQNERSDFTKRCEVDLVHVGSKRFQTCERQFERSP